MVGREFRARFGVSASAPRPASERSSSSRGGSWRPCQEVAWRRAVFLMPVPVFPDASGSSRGALSGSVPLDLLSCSFSFLQLARLHKGRAPRGIARFLIKCPLLPATTRPAFSTRISLVLPWMCWRPGEAAAKDGCVHMRVSVRPGVKVCFLCFC